jgi:hypothetical protein
MADEEGEGTGAAAGDGRLYRETVYLHADELQAVGDCAKRKRCSKAETIRRALRSFFQIED